MTDSTDNTSLIAGLEACRPGSDDVASPELSFVARAIEDDEAAEQLYARIQQSDTALARAFRDVAAPEGLQDRLLTSLAAAAPACDVLDKDRSDVDPSDEGLTDEALTDVGQTSSAAASPAAAKPARSKRARSKRTWWYSAAFVGTAACLLIAAVFAIKYFGREDPLTESDVVRMALRLHQHETDDWNADLAAAPQSRPVSPLLKRTLLPAQWHPVEELGDANAVAYRYASPRLAPATLYVFAPRATITGLPAAPPLNPQLSSGATVGAWTTGGLVYVLVVDGTEDQYRGFLRSTTLAMLTRPALSPGTWAAPVSRPHILPIWRHV